MIGQSYYNLRTTGVSWKSPRVLIPSALFVSIHSSDDEIKALQSDPRSYLYSTVSNFDDEMLGIPPAVLEVG